MPAVVDMAARLTSGAGLDRCAVPEKSALAQQTLLKGANWLRQMPGQVFLEPAMALA
jgi:hypothetical protein